MYVVCGLIYMYITLPTDVISLRIGKVGKMWVLSLEVRENIGTLHFACLYSYGTV